MPIIYRIDSRDRLNSSLSNTDFVVNTDPVATLSAQVKMVIVPNVFNNIRSLPESDANATYSYEIGGVPGSFTIPDGFYNITQLITYIEAQIAVTIVADANTGLLTLTNNTGADFEIITYADGNLIGDVLGISATSTLANGASSTFGNKYNLYSYQMVYIASRRLSDGFNVVSGAGRFPVIATVPIDVEYGGLIYYEVAEQHEIIYPSTNNIEEIDIQLVNHYGHVIPLPPNYHIQVLVEFQPLASMR